MDTQSQDMQKGVVVDDIIGNDDKLSAKASELAQINVKIDDQETIGKGVEVLNDPSVRAILVNKRRGNGAVKSPTVNVVINSAEQDGFVIVPVQQGEKCILLGERSLRYFRSY